MIIDNAPSNNVLLNKEYNNLELREAKIIERIIKHYSQKLGREVQKAEACEIADNLLNFAKAIYGT